MVAYDREAGLAEDVKTILVELGFHIVELHVGSVKGRMHVHLVIYRPEGVTIDDCAEVHKAIRPRAELLLNDRDVALQVASPGIDRTFKELSEFVVFQNRGVRILLHGADDWIGGVVEAADDRAVSLRTGKDCRSIAYADIQKARLDHSQEVR